MALKPPTMTALAIANPEGSAAVAPNESGKPHVIIANKSHIDIVQSLADLLLD
jgi:hypothetical protein